jgi:EthD domain
MTYRMHYLPRRNPLVARADWPTTWRSHAIFASQFPVLTGALSWMRYTNRIEPGEDEPALPDWLSRDYDGVSAAAALTAETFDGSGFTADQRAQIDTDEMRVFADLTPNYSFYCKETLAQGQPQPGGAAVFAFLVRASGMALDPFIMRWHREHAALAKPSPGGIVRSSWNRPHAAMPAAYPFDGIGEYWFATDADAVAAVLDGGLFAPLREDLTKFCDMERSVLMLTSVFHGWPKPWMPGADPLGRWE